jgi:hypothetical protein
MIARAVRLLLRRIGIRLPFGGVICAETSKRIAIEGDWRARVTTRQTLVFTEQPCPGDLRDSFAFDPGTPPETLFYDSPDAVEVGRRRRSRNSLQIAWLPKAPVTLYALYAHEDTWLRYDSHRQSAIAAHYRCDMKTGAFGIEFTTPGLFEAGVMFRSPRWRPLRSERALVKHALAMLNAPGAVVSRFDGPAGARLASWQITGPRRGERFYFVVFHEHGVADWEQRLRKTSIAGRIQKRVAEVAHAFRA